MSENKPLEKDVSPDVLIDAKHLNSPVPLLRLKKELEKIDSGCVVQIDCSDSGSCNDIVNWCSRKTYSYLGYKQKVDCSSYFVQKE